MLLTEARLRALIYDILLEGVREDAAALEAMLKGNLKALEQFQSLSTKPKWVNWLADRYLRQKYKENENLPDVLSLVVKFVSKDAAISQKYNANKDENKDENKEKNQFKADVDAAFPPESRGWQNPADVTKMSSRDLNTILALYNRKKQRLEVDRADESWKQDKIGQFGPWALYFPSNQRNSISIAGADPVTLMGYTDWCTARTAGSNLFYNYVGKGTMLFYAIDESKPPTDTKSRISLGYIRGKLDARGGDGGVTVDAQNNGLMMPDLQKIFGSHLNGILAAAKAVVKHHGAEHPAKAEFAVACQDVVKFKSMLSGLSDDEAGELCQNIMDGAKTVSAEVVLAAASHKSASVRKSAVYNKSTPPHVLEKLAGDADASVRADVARKLNTPPRALEELAADADASVRWTVADNPSARPRILEKLADDADPRVRARAAGNKSTPPHVLEKLAVDPKKGVRHAVAYNPSSPPHVLEKLADGAISGLGTDVLSNPSTPTHVFEKLADDSDAAVRERVAGSPFTPPHVLEKLAFGSDARLRFVVSQNMSTPLRAFEKLADDSDKWVRVGVASNASTPAHVFEKLADDSDEGVRYAVARNVKTPIHVKEKLMSDPEQDTVRLVSLHVARSRKARPEFLEQLSSSDLVLVTQAVARNPKTPLSALRALAQHKDKKTRKAAQATLAKLQPMGEARRLAHRIIAELKRR